MNLSTLQVKNTNGGPFCSTSCSFSGKNSCKMGKVTSLRMVDGRFVEIRNKKFKAFPYPSLVVRAMRKENRQNPSSSGNDDQSIPENDGPKGKDPASDKVISDWRTFRANLVAREQVQDVDTKATDDQEAGSHDSSKPLGLKWAHPILVPESGCVLVATEKLDGVHTFERTVVLLLRSGTRSPYEGPFGVILNRPLNKRIKHMTSSNLNLAATFADCSLHIGGPLEASMFLLRTEENSQLRGFEQVLPGLCFGSIHSFDKAAALLKEGMLNPKDLRFFVGYAGWQFDQLKQEIESNFWYVAACSSNLIFDNTPDASDGLWKEILQLMGGHYSELSQKPEQDSQ